MMKTLKQDISLTLLIKFTLLTLLWFICFHHPKLPINLEKQFFPITAKTTKITAANINSVPTSR
ncbi:MAG: hypothetical protein A3F46_07785 [Legionellales bacterium RIFCSPHIGHO2_12_FULL_42_9]|nr:MAG: hypothetical protein A3F46_07785 [Legionellales bacterium RIFCSPHIGHO2_12_FULL_42_9]